jgi:hypothetical protein|tara:strand:+ start:547 stop:720 length:174 start_codon:yes stop_codon:yes gene_type:complete
MVRYGQVSLLKRMKELEKENRRLKRFTSRSSSKLKLPRTSPQKIGEASSALRVGLQG